MFTKHDFVLQAWQSACDWRQKRYQTNNRQVPSDLQQGLVVTTTTFHLIDPLKK